MLGMNITEIKGNKNKMNKRIGMNEPPRGSPIV
jgi:hypothetical protein